jgi:uncharacterized membrane protein (Fun14 family)
MSGTKDDGARKTQTKRKKDRQPLPQWKKGLLAMAAVLVVAGAALKVAAALQEDGGHNVVQDPHVGPGGPKTLDPHVTLVPSGPPRPPLAPPTEEAGSEETASDGPSTLGEWSPSLVKGGFGFFLGFCVGYALRTFFRLGAVAIGLALMALLGLSYAGVLPPLDWAAIEGPFNRLAESLGEQASGFRTFLAGNLPSAGLSGLGVFTGVKKN